MKLQQHCVTRDISVSVVSFDSGHFSGIDIFFPFWFVRNASYDRTNISNSPPIPRPFPVKHPPETRSNTIKPTTDEYRRGPTANDLNLQFFRTVNDIPRPYIARYRHKKFTESPANFANVTPPKFAIPPIGYTFGGGRPRCVSMNIHDPLRAMSGVPNGNDVVKAIYFESLIVYVRNLFLNVMVIEQQR